MMEPAWKYKPYPDYKDSGIDWLGYIPRHWKMSRLGFHASVKARLGWKGLKAEEYLDEGYVFLSTPNIKGSEIDFANVNYISEQRYLESPEIMLRDGDILLAKDGSTLGITNVIRNLPSESTVNSSIAVIRTIKQIFNIFLYYLLCCEYTQKTIQKMKDGQGVPHLFQADIIKFVIWLPPVAEQKAIASFLDRETARIDELIAKKEQLIALLEEKRTALISHAVTKGLNPDAKMKDSGIEWLGEIPEHWSVFPVKRSARKIQTGITPPTAEPKYYEHEDIPWYGPSSFGRDLSVSSPVKMISNTALAAGVARLFEAGTTLIITIGATIGKVGYLPESGTTNQQITAITFNRDKICPMYGAYQLKRLEQVIRGIAPNTTLPILDLGKIGYLPLLLPPLKEQTLIVRYIETNIKKIENIVDKNHEVIEKLQEYRTALISAAVTGKIDVREQI